MKLCEYKEIKLELFTLDWVLLVKEDPFLVLLFLNAGVFTFWVTCSPVSSLSTTTEDWGLRFFVTEGSLSLMEILELWSTQLVSWFVTLKDVSWERWNWGGGGEEVVFMLLGKNAGSTRKGWYWYEKPAMWERERVCVSLGWKWKLWRTKVMKERDAVVWRSQERMVCDKIKRVCSLYIYRSEDIKC